MGEFSKSAAGRVMALSIGIALVGGGISALMSGSEALLVMSVSLFLPIVVNIFALPTALEEHWLPAVASAIGLPVLLWIYAIGVGVAHAFHPALGYGFVVLGLGALAFAARSPQTARTAQREGAGRMVQQH